MAPPSKAGKMDVMIEAKYGLPVCTYDSSASFTKTNVTELSPTPTPKPASTNS
jgi:hypothetical protein